MATVSVHASAPAGRVIIPVWTLGDHLRKCRRVAGMTQAAFARELGVSEPTYSAWESDRNTPSNVVAMAKRVEVLTSVPASWVLGLDDPLAPALPRQDSDPGPQPTDYAEPQVDAKMVDLAAWRERRATS